MKDILGNNLSPREIKNLIVEGRNVKARVEGARKDVKAFNYEQEELRAEERTADDDDAPVSTGNGLVLTNRSRHFRNNRPDALTNPFYTASAGEGIIRNLLEAVATGSLVHTFDRRATPRVHAEIPRNSSYQQANASEQSPYVKGFMEVAQPVALLVEDESAKIKAMQAQVASATDPEVRHDLEKRLLDFAQDREMVLLGKEYIHNARRVMNLNAGHIGKGPKLKYVFKDVEVCCLRLELGEVRGIKIVKGDDFDNDPRENIISGQHIPQSLKGPEAPSPH